MFASRHIPCREQNCWGEFHLSLSVAGETRQKTLDADFSGDQDKFHSLDWPRWARILESALPWKYLEMSIKMLATNFGERAGTNKLKCQKNIRCTLDQKPPQSWPEWQKWKSFWAYHQTSVVSVAGQKVSLPSNLPQNVALLHRFLILLAFDPFNFG